MTKSDTWMPLYIGDYLADTMHLSGAEHGAYLLLIIHYWRTGPLPDDDRKLSAIARTGRKEWDGGIGETVRAFFHAENGLLRHKRVDAEIANTEQMTAQRSAAGKASAAAKALKREAQRQVNDRSTTVENPLEVCSDFRATPSPSPSQSQEERKEELSPSSPSLAAMSSAQPDRTPATPAVRVQDSAEFSQFWQKYPRRVGKGAARPAFAKARKSASFEAIMAGLDRPWPTDPRYVPHPATWLNQQRWTDEIDRADPVLRAAGLDENGDLLASPVALDDDFVPSAPLGITS